jgi:hypothetical protein
VTSILVIAYVVVVFITSGVLIDRGYKPDPGIWMAVFWPMTVLVEFGAWISRLTSKESE